ncbi:hypothetical protein ARMGADRAFT_157704 [Armillaria gallica]|uniref:Uncharacterized protein n=1 Tax=Armillaria gallica TaxID=47427 RepID=A0A2H3CBR3_ARMGA|nr:hypothetical protein ARMGADRAFT_157704 [Armillaria gallica]
MYPSRVRICRACAEVSAYIPVAVKKCSGASSVLCTVFLFIFRNAFMVCCATYRTFVPRQRSSSVSKAVVMNRSSATKGISSRNSRTIGSWS